jgi:hypothetical protein
MMGWIFGEWEQKTVFDYVEEFDEWDVTNVEPCFFPYLAFVYSQIHSVSGRNCYCIHRKNPPRLSFVWHAIVVASGNVKKLRVLALPDSFQPGQSCEQRIANVLIPQLA